MFDIGHNHQYFDEEKNKTIMQKVAKKCYLPANALLHRLIKENNGSFKVSFSITGIFLEQCAHYVPEVLESFRQLAATGCVEFLGETYYHSLAYLYARDEFNEQVQQHHELMQQTFGKTPVIFRNTELIYNNELAHHVEKMGYQGVLAEGADHILGWKSPNFLYRAKTTNALKLLLKNYRLSDDIAFRFSSRDWSEWPLTAPKFSQWLSAINGNGHIVNLFMDYETLGEHQWEETGIFAFLEHLPHEILKHSDNFFLLPSEVIHQFEPVGELDIHNPISWADIERDVSAWLGNTMQQAAIRELYTLEAPIKASKNPELLKDWRRLQTSDHFYYMCTKWFADGDVHKYFNPYDSPYEAYITFMNIIADLKKRIT